VAATGSAAEPITRFGLITTNYSYGLPPSELFAQVVEVAAAAEASVFDSLWLPDHVVQGPVGDVEANTSGPERDLAGPKGQRMPIFDAPTLLSALAVTTNRLRLGQLVSPITLRNPALLAKIVTSVDVISGGRALLGMGAGWDTDEHRRYGYEFPEPRERLDRLEDAVQICRKMFDEETATYHGRYYSVDEAINEPRPINEHIPILIGGGGEKRTVRIAARYADAWNISGDVETLRRKISVLERVCEEIGRDPRSISLPGCVVFHRVDMLLQGIESCFTASCDGVILIPWQQRITPDFVASIGESVAAEFGATT
jgi:F420-dependent oxidoreductase-like protein